MPDEDAEADIAAARRADALVALCSGAISEDADAGQATVVVHAPLAALASGEGGCEIEDGGTIHAETARRLLCNARVQSPRMSPEIRSDSAGWGASRPRG